MIDVNNGGIHIMRDESFYNRVGGERISDRHISELIGLARGLCADSILNDDEIRFLEKWLAASVSVADHPLIRTLTQRVNYILYDGIITSDERMDLIETLGSLAGGDFELGETLKSSTLPLCDPAPTIEFIGRHYTFTGTFMFGKRQECEAAVKNRGATFGSLTQKTHYLVIGLYATESWKQSSFGNKILQAADHRAKGIPISIVSEEHWTKALGE